MEKYLTVDIGGTFIKYSMMDSAYHVYEEGSLATAKASWEFLEQLKSVVLKYKGRISGIALCIAGFIHPESGENTDFSVGRHFREYNLKKELSAFSGLNVSIENDSNCAALGEMIAGAGKGCKNLCLLTIGTGIGGGIIVNGKLMRGSHFKAGEAGLMKMYAGEGFLSSCEYAGATSSLVREVSQALGKKVDGYYIFDEMDTEPQIAEIYKSWLNKLALTAGNAAMLLDPEIILIGGGISVQARFIKDLKTRVYELYPHLEEYTRIAACTTGNLAGRIGALHVHKEEYQ